MADKKDLAEAQSYSRRRLVTAFTSGIPSGVELTPKKNQTPIIVGVGLALIAMLAGVFYGIMSPSLPSNWQNNKLIVAKDSAARYVSVDGTLHPVINAISARLLIPSSDFSVITVKDDQLAGIPVGSTIGILGAPDSLPAKGQLAAGSITSCTSGGSIENIISGTPAPALDADRAIVATVDHADYLITGSKRHELPSSTTVRDSFLRALGIPQTNTVNASVQWLNLFDEGTPIAPIDVPGEGRSVHVRGVDLHAGDVITQEGDATHTDYLVLDDGSITALDPFAAGLYGVGKTEAQTRPKTVSAEDFQQLANAPKGVIPADWPTHALKPVDSGTVMCATLPLKTGSGPLASRVRLAERSAVKSDSGSNGVGDAAGTAGSSGSAATGTAAGALAAGGDGSSGTAAGASSDDGDDPDAPSITTSVTGGTGALVRASIGDSGKGTVFAIDSTGTAYPIPDATEEILNRLGYAGGDVRNIPRAWVDVFPSGVQLTPAAAGDAPNPQAVLNNGGNGSGGSTGGSAAGDTR